MTPTLQIIIASTRPGRVGPSVAAWLRDRAEAHGGFDVEVIDLAEVDLPMFNEPRHPRFGEYTHAHTKEWSQTIGRGDAFVFVMPEYNYGYTAPLKNAIDYLYAEWQYKPVGLVSYGGVAAGTRAVQMIKQVVTTLKMVPITESVNISFVHQLVGDDAAIAPGPEIEAAASAMLDEIVRWASALRALRDPAA